MTNVMHHWADWIAATALSQWLQNYLWIVPTSQSIHIVMISVVFGCAVIINLRLLGVSAGGRSVSALVRTLIPWMYGALLLLLLTGTVQTIAEPVRQLITPAFWWKMTMIVAVVCITRWFVGSVRRDPARWDASASRPRSGRLIGLVCLALWVAIIYCGRFIAYTWEFHL